MPFCRPFLALLLLGILLWRPGALRAQTPPEPTPAASGEINRLLLQSHDLEGSDTQAALDRAGAALSDAQAASLPGLELESLLQLGRVQRLINDYPATLDTVDRGIVQARTRQDARLLGEFFLLRGLVEWNQAKIPEATVSMMEAFHQSDLSGDPSLRIGALYGRGLVRGRTDDLDGALENISSALQLAEQTGDSRLGPILNSMGVLYLSHKDYPPARAYLERALATLRQTTNRRTTAYALLNLGQLATETGDQDAAGKYLDESLAICTRFGFQRGLADIYYLQAARLRRLGRPDEAIPVLDQALALAGTLGNPDLFVSVYQEYIQTEQARGDYRAALDYTRKLADKLELVRGEKTRREAAEIQARYEAANHARELEHLQRLRAVEIADLAVKRAELRSAHILYGSLAVILLLAGATFAALASRQRAHARLAERQLVETRAAKAEVEVADAHKAELLTIAARDLRDSEARFRSAFEHSPLGLALVGLDGGWLRVNQALCRIVGYTEAELLARDFQSITHPDDLADDLGLVAQLRAGEIDTYSLEKRYLHRQGHPVWVRLDVSLVQDPADKLPRYFISQIQDITEHRRSQELLHAAKEEAEKSNEAKNAFLSRMSHELRTPLNAILGFGQLLEGVDLGERHNPSVTHIVTSGRHLLELIDEVLDIAQIEGGHFNFNVEPTDFAEALEDVSERLEPQACLAEVTLHLPPAGGPSQFVQADPRRLRQVLTHLLSNAVKYNRRGGEVFVRWGTAPDRVRLEVIDTGVGISAEDLEQIFRPFIRLRATEGVRGTGLGLSVSQALTEVMGGTLAVTSEPGRGSTFSVEFPRLSAGDLPRMSASALDEFMAGFYEEPAAEGTVLYIEDNPDNLELVRYIFTTLPDKRLRVASTGCAGVASAMAAVPDLILLDIDLPDMNGVEVLTRLRRDPATAAVPVVVVSADATAHQIENLRRLGVRDYLTKPFDLTRFLQVVGNSTPVR